MIERFQRELELQFGSAITIELLPGQPDQKERMTSIVENLRSGRPILLNQPDKQI